MSHVGAPVSNPALWRGLLASSGPEAGVPIFYEFPSGKGIMTVHDLPAVNASLNGLSAIFLAAGYIFIRRKSKTAHRNCMIAAFVTSIFFLRVT